MICWKPIWNMYLPSVLDSLFYLFVKNITAWNMSSCCPTSNLLAALLENAPIGQAMSYPIFKNKAATILLAKMVQQQQAEYRACNFRQLYNCNKPPSKNIAPKMLSFFAWCVSRLLKDYAIEHTAALKGQKTTNQTVASLGTIFWSSLTFAWLKGQWRQPDPQHFPRFLWATSVNTNNPVAGSV